MVENQEEARKATILIILTVTSLFCCFKKLHSIGAMSTTNTIHVGHNCTTHGIEPHTNTGNAINCNSHSNGLITFKEILIHLYIRHIQPFVQRSTVRSLEKTMANLWEYAQNNCHRSNQQKQMQPSLLRFGASINMEFLCHRKFIHVLIGHQCYISRGT